MASKRFKDRALSLGLELLESALRLKIEKEYRKLEAVDENDEENEDPTDYTKPQKFDGGVTYYPPKKNNNK